VVNILQKLSFFSSHSCNLEGPFFVFYILLAIGSRKKEKQNKRNENRTRHTRKRSKSPEGMVFLSSSGYCFVFFSMSLSVYACFRVICLCCSSSGTDVVHWQKEPVALMPTRAIVFPFTVHICNTCAKNSFGRRCIIIILRIPRARIQI